MYIICGPQSDPYDFDYESIYFGSTLCSDQKLLLALHLGIILEGEHMRFSGLMLRQPCAWTINLAPDKSIFKVVLCPVHLGC